MSPQSAKKRFKEILCFLSTIVEKWAEKIAKFSEKFSNFWICYKKFMFYFCKSYLILEENVQILLKNCGIWN